MDACRTWVNERRNAEPREIGAGTDVVFCPNSEFWGLGKGLNMGKFKRITIRGDRV